MAQLSIEFRKLLDPKNIFEAQYASSPYVLRKCFAMDNRVRTIIAMGDPVIPFIGKMLNANFIAGTNDITLSCIIYILYSLDRDASRKILREAYREIVKRDDAFSIHFATHALRSFLGLPVKKEEIVYGKPQVDETLLFLERV